MNIRRKRRLRYSVVFGSLILAFAVIVVLNINTGNVKISIPDILRILFLREAKRWSIILYGKFVCHVF